jgi:hypothetical protein
MRRLPVLFLFTLLLLAGCGDEEGFTQIQPQAALARVFNGIPESPVIIVLVDGVTLQTVNFGETPGFEVVNVVTGDMDVFYGDANNQRQDLATGLTVDLDNAEELTVIAMGTLDNPRFISIINPAHVPSGSTSQTQFVHAASRISGTVQMTIRESQSGEVVHQESLGQGQHSELITLDGSAFYEIEAVLAGDNEPIWSSGSFLAFAQTRSMNMLMDYVGPGDHSARVVQLFGAGSASFQNESIPGGVRIANFSTNPDALDLRQFLSDGSVLGFVDGAVNGEITEYLSPAANISGFEAIPTGEPVVVGRTPYELTRGTFNTLLIGGDIDARTLFATIGPDSNRSIATIPQLTMFSAASPNLFYNVFVVTPDQEYTPQTVPVVINMDFLSRFSVTPPPDFDLYITASHNGELLLGPVPFSLEAGHVYSLFLHESGGSLQILQKDDTAR